MSKLIAKSPVKNKLTEQDYKTLAQEALDIYGSVHINQDNIEELAHYVGEGMGYPCDPNKLRDGVLTQLFPEVVE